MLWHFSHCEFQDISSRRITESAEERNGLYYLTGVRSSFGQRSLRNVPFSAVSNQSCFGIDALGIQSFICLKTLYSHLFINKDIHSFRCEHCISAKQTRTHYPIRSYKSPKPFYLVHTDIWGPTCSSTLSGARWFMTFIDDYTIDLRGLPHERQVWEWCHI